MIELKKKTPKKPKKTRQQTHPPQKKMVGEAVDH